MPNKTDERPRVYLNKVHLKGFKSIEDLTIDFQKGLNILIGKNGAGKSNFMEFIDKALHFRGNSRIIYRYSQLEFISDDKHLFTVEVEREANLKIDKDNLSNRIESKERFLIDDQIVFDNSKDLNSRRIFQFKNKSIPYHGISTGLFYYLGYKHVYSTYVKYNLPDNLGFIEASGTIEIKIEDNFYDWEFAESLSFINDSLWILQNYYQDESEPYKRIIQSDVFERLKFNSKITDNLKLYSTIEDVRFISNLNIYHTEKSIIIDNIKLEFKINGNWLPWSQLSDGTKRLFYIISEITFSEGLVLIEEPELGIHPHQFNLLMDFLKEQSEEKQIIISTHSPKALDHLSPEELNNILIAYYDLDKGTQIRHLSDKEVIKAKKYMKEVGFFSDYWMLSDLE